MSQSVAQTESIPIYERITPGARRAIFLCALLACIVSGALNTILNTVLPAITRDFSITSDVGQWLSSGYSLAMAISMPLTAFLATRVPTKPLYMVSLALFCVGLVISAVAPNFEVLMAGRLIQACGNGIFGPLVQVILLTIYPPKQRGSIMGWYGLSIGAAPVVAPTIGGIVVDILSWRYIFYFSIAFTVVAGIGSLLFLKNVLETHESSFDAVSFALSAVVFGGLTLGIGNLSSLGIADAATLVPLAAGLVATPVFVRRQMSSDEPFLDLRVFADKTFCMATVGSMLLYFVMMAVSIMVPLFVQDIAGMSATKSGLAMLPGSLLMALLSPVTGKVFDRMGIKALLIAGGVIMTASNAGMLFIGADDAGVLVLTLLFLVRSAAIACLMMPLVTWGVGALPDDKNAHGTSLISTLRTLAGAIGMSVGVGIMNSVAGAMGSILTGFRVSFALLSALSALLVVIGVIEARRSRGDRGRG